MPTTTFDIKSVQTAAQKSAQRAFHAGVGVTDLAVEVVRDYAAEAQKRAQQRFAAAQKNVKSVTEFDAKARRAAVEKRVAELRAEAAAAPARFQDSAVATYGDLVKRGESLVGRIRRQQSTQEAVAAAETTVAKAKATRTQAKKAAAKKTATAKSSAKATRTSARKTVSAGSRALADAAQKVGD